MSTHDTGLPFYQWLKPVQSFMLLSTVRNVCTCTEWVGQVRKHTQYGLGTGAKSVVNVGCMYIRTYVYSMEELVVWGLGVL